MYSTNTVIVRISAEIPGPMLRSTHRSIPKPLQAVAASYFFVVATALQNSNISVF